MAGDRPPADDLHRRIAHAVARIGLALRNHAQGIVPGERLMPLQRPLLEALAGRPEGMRVGALARELAVTDATASDAVSTLVRRGLVAKGRDPEEHRAVRVMLTRKGREVAAEASRWPDFLAPAVAALPDEDRATVLRGLLTMLGALEDQGELAPARMCPRCRYLEIDADDPEAGGFRCVELGIRLGPEDLRVDCPAFAPRSVEHRNA